MHKQPTSKIIQNKIINSFIRRNTIKQYPKTARKIRGNTLVPVVIGLLIAAIATVAFLNQGESLLEQNDMMMATNEVMAAVSSMQRVINSGQIPSSDSTGISATNVFGETITFDGTKITYPLLKDTACEAMLANFKTNDTYSYGLKGAACSQKDLELTFY